MFRLERPSCLAGTLRNYIVPYFNRHVEIRMLQRELSSRGNEMTTPDSVTGTYKER